MGKGRGRELGERKVQGGGAVNGLVAPLHRHHFSLRIWFCIFSAEKRTTTFLTIVPDVPFFFERRSVHAKFLTLLQGSHPVSIQLLVSQERSRRSEAAAVCDERSL